MLDGIKREEFGCIYLLNSMHCVAIYLTKAVFFQFVLSAVCLDKKFGIESRGGGAGGNW
jgi:hypothetical protein